MKRKPRRTPVKQRNTERIARRKAYAKYLRSPTFQALRFFCFLRDKYACRRCGAEATYARRNGKTEVRGLEVHHLRYTRVPNESLADVITLCRSCHRKTEAEKGYRRRFLNGGSHVR